MKLIFYSIFNIFRINHAAESDMLSASYVPIVGQGNQQIPSADNKFSVLLRFSHEIEVVPMTTNKIRIFQEGSTTVLFGVDCADVRILPSSQGSDLYALFVATRFVANMNNDANVDTVQYVAGVPRQCFRKKGVLDNSGLIMEDFEFSFTAVSKPLYDTNGASVLVQSELSRPLVPQPPPVFSPESYTDSAAPILTFYLSEATKRAPCTVIVQSQTEDPDSPPKLIQSIQSASGTNTEVLFPLSNNILEVRLNPLRGGIEYELVIPKECLVDLSAGNPMVGDIKTSFRVSAGFNWASQIPTRGQDFVPQRATIFLEFEDAVGLGDGQCWMCKLPTTDCIKLDRTATQVGRSPLWILQSDFLYEIGENTVYCEETAFEYFIGLKYGDWQFTVTDEPRPNEIPFVQKTVPLPGSAITSDTYIRLYFDQAVDYDRDKVITWTTDFAEYETIRTNPSTEIGNRMAAFLFYNPNNVQSVASRYAEMPEGRVMNIDIPTGSWYVRKEQDGEDDIRNIDGMKLTYIIKHTVDKANNIPALHPLANANYVPTCACIQLQFRSQVRKGQGGIYIKNLDTGTVHIFDFDDDSQISFIEDRVLLYPPDLDQSARYETVLPPKSILYLLNEVRWSFSARPEDRLSPIV